MTKAHHYPVKLMGSGFVLTAIHEDKQLAWDAIRAAEAEIIRIENLISSWKSDSETTAINNAAGLHPVQVSDELFQLITRSLKISELTAGAFDLSGTLSRYYWNFNKLDGQLLPEEQINELCRLVNYRNIKLDSSSKSVFLSQKGMKIGFGGIGKGYAANRAKKAMLDLGVTNGLINASGDVICWGRPPQEDYWTIKLPNPQDKKSDLAQITIPEGSVITSGDYEKYSMIDGKRYSHIINPRTGMPVTHTKNVTVISPDAEFGDALATGISVLGADAGVPLVNKLNGVECIIIDNHNIPHYSNNLKNNTYA